MHGIRIHEVEKINGYGYRIDNKEEKISVYDKDTKVLEICPFDQDAQLWRLCFTQMNIEIFVLWVSIKPKKKEKGIMIGYNKDGKLLGEEIVPEESEPSN
jgi:hypothetical protein